MPTTNFLEYVQVIRDVLDATLARGDAEILTFDIDQRSRVRGFIKGTLKFGDGSELHFREFIDLTLTEPRLMYGYHYQQADKSLVLRYDNAAHRPPLLQPEHKHTSNDVFISSMPTLAQVIDEIMRSK
ncbi:MAG: hypothetical protein HY327_01040 [Chloroflexi bacterium]|nr:hypothetical protein [Chloroflexota bacterium]